MGMKSAAAAAAVAVGTALAVCILQLTRRPTDLEGVQLCHNAEFEVLLLLLALLLARSSPEIAPPRSESEERGNMPAAAALTPLARSFLPRVLSLLLCCVSLPRTHSH